MKSIELSRELLLERFEYVFEPALRDELLNLKNFYHYPAESIIMDLGDPISHIPLVLNGSIKVLREDEDKAELLLYYLESGDTCSITLNCVTGNARSQIRAIAETEVDLLFVEVGKMEIWMAQYPSWRRYVLDSFQTRVDELLTSIDHLAFLDMSQRLRVYLKDKALINKNEVLTITHSQIANDLNTSRVVISRLLKKLEKENYIQQKRNELRVVNLLS